MLGTVLLIIGLVGLVLTLLSLVGVDLDIAADLHLGFDVGDSGVGLLSLLTPFVTGFGLLSGGLMVLRDVPALPALAAGAALGLVLAVIAGFLLSYLLKQGTELPSVDLIGAHVRVVEPVGPGRLGTGEVKTEIGTRQISIAADESYVLGDYVRITNQMEGRTAYHVERLPYDQPDVS
ncbi:hypothetical protein HUN08_08995 [Gordonia sp. X0973]|uniref:hypothetical protein n=1 Tax=Gordonia sp. X0973 TaxID=2742602 RepID=UPI000F530DB6|nr:hypothetical protein [Gordonia sp. X0973]QKT07307.1 hypothetical protein HUN08_08995 [Gordonia sp. X0973]